MTSIVNKQEIMASCLFEILKELTNAPVSSLSCIFITPNLSQNITSDYKIGCKQDIKKNQCMTKICF